MEKEQKTEKTIDELAREAMEAIKESSENEERKIERDAKDALRAKEAAMKNEVERKIKRKLIRLEKEEVKKNKSDDIDTSFMVNWTNKNGAGIQYIGEYNEKELFKISRGINLFHLKVISRDVICEEWRINAHTSINLVTLKKKADKILNESNKIKKIKTTPSE